MKATTASKGKSKEESNWQTGWYDVYPALEHPQRPIEWSNSSIIFTGYGVQPAILARHFFSSKQFIMPSPPPLVSEPDSYGPATVISVSPDDSWLFAYFPNHSNAGICCLWNRATELDNWRVMDWWAHHVGVVMVDWVGLTREWAIDTEGSPFRLPSRGPRSPVSHPTLLLVTEDHQLVLCYLRHYMTVIKLFSCSLLQPSSWSETTPKREQEPMKDLNSIKTCIKASLCLNYSDSSILVAMRSQNHPLPIPTPQFNPMDLGIPSENDEAGTEVLDGMIEEYEEDSVIELCEVQLRFDRFSMSLSSRPLPPIQALGKKIKDLHFVSQPPLDKNQPSSVCLVSSFYDFGDFSSLPSSKIICHSFTRQPQNEAAPWLYKEEASRSFENHQLGFLAPLKHLHGTRELIVGLYYKSSSQSPSTSKARETVIGSLRVLKVPDLVDNQEWEELPIVKANGKVGQDIPVNVVVSPNQALLCTLSSSIWTSQTSVQRMPQPKHPISPLALRLALAFLAERSPTDILHQLSNYSLSSDMIANTLTQTFTILSEHQPKSSRAWIRQVGITVEVYRLRALRASEEEEKEDATARWEVAHDICSLVSSNYIFQECTTTDGYNLDAIWELVGLCTWIVSCVDKIMKECVLYLEVPSSDEKENASVQHPALLAIMHPGALEILSKALTNVKRYREFIGSRKANTENTKIARDVLLDEVDRSGIDLSELLHILVELSDAVKETRDDQQLRSLALCQPTNDMQHNARPHLLKILNKKVVDKSRLFIKAHDFIDGMSRISIDSQKHRDKDVVTKSLLLTRPPALACLRCGGQAAEISKLDPTTPKIIGFINRSWVRRCICGGPWTRAM